MKTILLIVLLSISNLAAAGDTVFFYLRQIPGDFESFTLISSGKGMFSLMLTKKEVPVRVEKEVFKELWKTFPITQIEPYRLDENSDIEINALHNHVIKIQQSVEGKEKNSSFMVPHSSAPQEITDRLSEFLRIFGEKVKVNTQSSINKNVNNT